MKNDIVFLPLSKLKSHESICKEQLQVVFNKIKTDGIFYNPVIVDNREFIILDGHHRVAALKLMGAKTVPVFLVDYQGRNIRIYLRRKKLLAEFIKERVISAALSGKMLPHKTTRHHLNSRPNRIKVNLRELF